MIDYEDLLPIISDLHKRIAAIDIRQGGPVGARGKTGPQGKTGPKGKDGGRGKDGESGKDGKDGRNGKDGAPGKAGPKGERGPKGADGKTGDMGGQGLPGRDGEDGISIVDVRVDFDNHLVVSLSDGNEIDAGHIEADTDNTQTIFQGSSGFPSGGSEGQILSVVDGRPTWVYWHPDLGHEHGLDGGAPDSTYLPHEKNHNGGNAFTSYGLIPIHDGGNSSLPRTGDTIVYNGGYAGDTNVYNLGRDGGNSSTPETSRSNGGYAADLYIYGLGHDGGDSIMTSSDVLSGGLAA